MKTPSAQMFVAAVLMATSLSILAQQGPPPLNPSDARFDPGPHYLADPSGIKTARPAVVHPGQIGLYKASQMSKAGSSLARLFAEYRAHLSQGNQSPFQPSNQFLMFHAGRVLVDASAADNGRELYNDLLSLGLQQGSHYGVLVSGMFPVAMLEKAVALDNLRSITAARPPIRNAGSITSQGVVALRADVARSVNGVDGSGVTVGVLSDSFNTLGGAAADIASGDLPSSGVTVVGGESPYCGTVVYCIDEGRAMLQIVHDLAPGADLLFHTALASKADYANAISSLASAGADVVVDDLLYLNEPMFQDGIVAQAVDSVVASGTAYFSAAGNAGRKSYEANFNDSGVIFCIEFFEPIGDCHPLYERVGRMHDFDPGPGVDLYQSVTVPVDGVLTIALQWDEPFGVSGGSRTDYDIVLLDQTGGIYYEISANDNVTTREGWEVLQFQNAEVLYGVQTSYNVIITYDDVDSIGPPTNRIKTVVFGSGNTLIEHQTQSGTLFGHANAVGAVAVGAAYYDNTPEFGTSPPILEGYSSAGGTSILFAKNGSSITPVVRQKPEITAVDGVNTTFFFNDAVGNDGIDDFFGTSAAAPHAAAVAALMMQARWGATPTEVKASLQNTAIDMGSAGFDYDSGYGLIQADAATADILSGGSNAPPFAMFSYDCAGSSCSFDSTGSSDDVGITSYAWDFGDGEGSSLANPSHKYATAGDYDVTLTVEDAEALGDSETKTVSISDTNAAPVAVFTYACSALDCSFDASGSSDDVGIVSYAWDFGDGSGSGVNPSHSYSAQGNYTVTLTVEDADSASNTVSASFRVKNRGNTSGASSGGGGDTGGTTIEAEKGRKKCTDGIDNDGDGLIDGADPEC